MASKEQQSKIGKSNRGRGQAAERELKNKLKESFPEYSDFLHRNHSQVESGGYDIIGIPGWAIESKYVENFLINGMWKQAVEQAKDNNIPVILRKIKLKGWFAYIHLSSISSLLSDVSLHDARYVVSVPYELFVEIVKRIRNV